VEAKGEHRMSDETIVRYTQKREQRLPAHESARVVERDAKHPERRAQTETEFENVLAHIARLYMFGKSVKDISVELNIARTSVLDVYLVELRRRWRISADMDFAERQAMELAKIDTLEEQFYVGWLRSLEIQTKQRQLHVYKGKEKVPSEHETIAERQNGDPRFLEGALKCVERRCKLLGIDPETKIKLMPPTPEQSQDLDERLAKYASQFGVAISITAHPRDADEAARGQRARESVDTERSAPAAVGVSDVIDADWRDSEGSVLRGRSGRRQE
jgi:hypothetical protein